MPPHVLSHDVYTIAWICALPLEMAAAKLMLDEIHGSLAQPSTDHNCYTLGSIHGHNIVIACLPSGVYGTISATTVLAQMLPTFRSLKFGLMVGIGGGVPTKADVRLGDVVVGIPSATSGGVIQYDHGKTLHSGRFEWVGALNKPPQVLLTAVSQLRSDNMVGRRSKLGQAMPTGLRQGQFSRPVRDLLFNPGYVHQNPDVDCSTCDQDELVHREPRHDDEPRIHYGLIASGDQVLKDAKTRNAIAQELDILCFEMEAAGLVDQLQCLVIRGVCEYCDSQSPRNGRAMQPLRQRLTQRRFYKSCQCIAISAGDRNDIGWSRSPETRHSLVVKITLPPWKNLCYPQARPGKPRYVDLEGSARLRSRWSSLTEYGIGILTCRYSGSHALAIRALNRHIWTSLKQPGSLCVMQPR